jgi:polar amino acid transport system permease protein
MPGSVTTADDRQATRKTISAMPMRPRFRPLRLAITIIGILVGLFAIDFMLQPGWRWDVVGQHLFSADVLAGVRSTIFITVLSLILGTAIGLLVCMARLSRYPVLRAAALAYVWVIRALPIMVVLLFIFFLAALAPQLGIGLPGLPPVLEVETRDVMTRFGAALTGLSLYFGGKAAEIFRGGYLAVRAGQHEAVHALGLSRWTALTRVTGPQAIRVLTPTMSNEVVSMVKNTSIVSVIGYGELLTTVQAVYAQTGQTIPLLMVACLWYLALSSVLMVGQMLVERRLSRGFTRRQHLPTTSTPATAAGSSSRGTVPPHTHLGSTEGVQP